MKNNVFSGLRPDKKMAGACGSGDGVTSQDRPGLWRRKSGTKSRGKRPTKKKPFYPSTQLPSHDDVRESAVAFPAAGQQQHVRRLRQRAGQQRRRRRWRRTRDRGRRLLRFLDDVPGRPVPDGAAQTMVHVVRGRRPAALREYNVINTTQQYGSQVINPFLEKNKNKTHIRQQPNIRIPPTKRPQPGGEGFEIIFKYKMS